ncbi:MAG: DEAD/DEAH box helicase family protein [Methanoregula sp.]|nr:DEAD/DEAH box helicase family protein [Methanoregula sp.]
MPQTVIENPVINSPFIEPDKHFRFSDEGITDEVIVGRRPSSRFVPIAQPKKKGKQLHFDTEWTLDRIEENGMINRIRERISLWRNGGYAGVTSTTRRLLDYWTSTEREKKFFFCQIEALETAIYMTEAASRYGDSWMESMLREANESSNPGLPRIAFKMATGTGKTVVMGMLIAWQALNKFANPQDTRFSDTFLIITPGITIRDRLRVLLPNDPDNYYRERDILSNDQLVKLGQAKIIITNFHTFLPREKIKAGKLTKSLLADGKDGVFTETPDQIVRRVCREFGTKKNILVINDEAHHCYWKKAEEDADKITGDERKEIESRDKDARIWISGIEAVKAKIGVKSIYDLSATPFFLKGSGWSEGTLFPWVVSDFSLIDAIEAGIVKVPRVPVADDSMTGALPTYRNIWIRIRDELPKKGRRTEAVTGEPVLPKELEGALHSLYSNYEKYYRLWEENTDAQAKGRTPPVFIVVCNNTNVSKLVFDHIAGWEKKIGDETVVQAGALPIFCNDDEHGGWLSRPNTILVDSEQLESGEAMSEEFKRIAAREIDEFKAEYRVRFPGRDTDKLTDEDILREVMNTVGKPGKLGEHVKCVVSVSMLTEGWDAQTVTHVLGVRAFGTQLLCEQVVGRALRRMSYATNEKGMFTPEYAEVYGVPFSFIPCSGSTTAPDQGPTPTRVRALEERTSCEITFPRLRGYRYEIGSEQLTATFSEESRMALSTADIPTETENAPVVGESSIHTLDDLKRRRPNEVAFLLAKVTLEKYFRDEDGNDKPWLFPQLLGITKRWLNECVTYKDNAFVQLLLLTQSAHSAADRIYHSIVQSVSGSPRLTPILQPYDTLGTTRFVDFDTIRGTFLTRADKCHVNYVVGDTLDWEQKTAMSLEDMKEMIRYVKNDHLGFTIPYTFEGEEHQYVPDFIAVMDDGHGTANPLNLIVEVTGERKPEKVAKISTAKRLWVPSVNNHGGYGRWAFFEVTDPHNVKTEIREYLRTRVSE